MYILYTLRYTLRFCKVHFSFHQSSQRFAVLDEFDINFLTFKKYTVCGDRTRDQRIKSPTLYLTELTRHIDTPSCKLYFYAYTFLSPTLEDILYCHN